MDKKILHECGLRGDGIADDGAALQRLLNLRPTLLEIPSGIYQVGRTLRIHSGTHLKLDAGAVIRLADGAAKNPHDYLLTNANPESGAANIIIEGGTWDGNNLGNPRPPGLFDAGYSGALLHFQQVDGLRLEHIRLHNAEAYYARFTQVRNFHIAAIRFSSDRVRCNNDGIHLGGHCENGTIRDLKGMHPGVTGDDMVALNADDALQRTEVRGMTCGPIRNVLIEDVEAQGCHSFVRLLSVWSPIENITIRRVRGTCSCAALNCDAARGCRVPLFDEANPPFVDGVGDLRNIEATDFRVAKSTPDHGALLRLETRMSNVRLQNICRDIKNDQAANQPLLRIRHVLVQRLVSQPGDHCAAVALDGGYECTAPHISGLEINPV